MSWLYYYSLIQLRNQQALRTMNLLAVLIFSKKDNRLHSVLNNVPDGTRTHISLHYK